MVWHWLSVFSDSESANLFEQLLLCSLAVTQGDQLSVCWLVFVPVLVIVKLSAICMGRWSLTSPFLPCHLRSPYCSGFVICCYGLTWREQWVLLWWRVGPVCASGWRVAPLPGTAQAHASAKLQNFLLLPWLLSTACLHAPTSSLLHPLGCPYCLSCLGWPLPCDCHVVRNKLVLTVLSMW